MILTKRDGSPAPKTIRVTREWQYDVNTAAEVLAVFTGVEITYEDVFEVIANLMIDDLRQPASENLPTIEAWYEVTNDTAQEQDPGSSHRVGINPQRYLPIDGGG